MKIKPKVYTVCMPASKVTVPEGYATIEKECGICGQKVVLSPDWETNIKENNVPEDIERVIICMSCHIIKMIEDDGKGITVNLKTGETKRKTLNKYGISDERIEEINRKMTQANPLQLLEMLRRIGKK